MAETWRREAARGGKRRFLVGCLAVIGLLTVLLVAGLVGAGFWAVSQFSRKEPAPGHFTLSLALSGSPRAGSGDPDGLRRFLRDGVSLHEISTTLDKAARDGRVQGLLLELRGARLTLAQAQELRLALARFADRGKPIIAYTDSFGESDTDLASYLVATIANEIWMQPSGTLDLSGPALERPYVAEALKTLGVGVRMDQRHQFKGGVDLFTQSNITPEYRAQLQALVDDLLAQTVEQIATARSLDPSEVRDVVEQSPLPAQDALTGKLVDGLGYAWEAEFVLGQKAKTTRVVSFFSYDDMVAGQAPAAPAAHIAMIDGVGPVLRRSAKEGPFADPAMTSDRLTRAFREAIADRKVKAILFRIDSPGGSYIASDTIHGLVKLARDAGKPVVVLMGSMAASGGYFAAMGADRIIALPGTLTGSIGVYSGKFVLSELWSKLGITWAQIESAEGAGRESFNRDFTPAEWARFQDQLDRIYADFTGKLAAGRKLTPDQVDAVARGRVWTGRQAKQVGLVDELGDVQTAQAALRGLLSLPPEAELALVHFPRADDDLTTLLSVMRAMRTIDAAAQTSARLEAWMRPLLEAAAQAEMQANGGVLTAPLTRAP